MLKLPLTFAFLFWVSLCLAQKTYRLNKDTSKNKNSFFWTKNYLYVICLPDHAQMPALSMIGINPNNISSINQYKDTAHTKRYGERAKNGIAFVVLKKQVKLLTFDQLLTGFHINDPYKSLPLYVDSALFYDPAHLCLEVNQIRFMRIDIEEGTGMKYINLRTTSHIDREAVHIR